MLKTMEAKPNEQVVSKSAVKELRGKFFKFCMLSDEQLPNLWPKKAKVLSFKVRCGEDRKAEHILVDKQNHFIYVEDLVVPSLRILHSFPNLYPHFMTDEGAIKFILRGAKVMCPGLTNENAHMDEVGKDTIVAIHSKNHDHALAIGITQMSTEDIRAVNEGVAVQIIHFVGDGFWQLLYQK